MNEVVKVFRGQKGHLVVIELKQNKAAVKFEGDNKLSIEVKFSYDVSKENAFELIKEALNLSNIKE